MLCRVERATSSLQGSKQPFTKPSARALCTVVAVTALLVAIGACAQREGDARLPTIAAIQRDIARADRSPEHYYANRYSREETRYWSRIAGWMVEDYIERSDGRHTPARAILDIGCGYGTLLAYASQLYGAPGTCFDVVGYLQPEIMQRYGLTYARGSVEANALPPGATYDVIIMTEVLEHFNFQPVPTLSKIRASLADGGAFFLSTPDAESSWGRITKYYPSLDSLPPLDTTATRIDGHVWQYSQAELERVLMLAGFAIRSLERVNGAQGKHFNVWAVKR
jgi:SAM-dependent methyltransferase